MQNLFLFFTFLISIILFNACQHFSPTPQKMVSDEESITQQVQIPDNVKRLEFIHENANLTVIGWEKPFVLIEGVKRARAQSVPEARLLVQSMQILIYERAPNRLVFEYKGIEDGRDDILKTIDYTANVPRDMIVDINTHNGKLTVSNLNRNVNIDHEAGELNVEGLQDNVEVKADKAQVNISNVEGSMTVYLHDTNAIIDTVGGNIAGRHSRGEIKISNLEGNLILSGDHSAITLNKITGRLDIDNNNGDVLCSDVYDGVDIQLVDGSLRLEPNIPVQRNYYCDIRKGDAVLRLPASSDMLLEVEVRDGRIHSDFPMPIWAERGISHARGAVNKGHRNVRVKVRNGAANIMKDVEIPGGKPDDAASTGGSTSSGSEQLDSVNLEATEIAP